MRFKAYFPPFAVSPFSQALENLFASGRVIVGLYSMYKLA
jgi:hypothetical protein